MSDLPKHARVVIIGAGIVGNSVAYHLAKLGWKDMVILRNYKKKVEPFNKSSMKYQLVLPIH